MIILARIICFRSILPVVFTLLMFGCADDGPAGPAGPTGAAGPVGATGATGATGTANVIYGSWFKPASYDMTTIFGVKTFTHTEAIPAITQEVLDKGVVLIYAKLLGYSATLWPVNQVGQLPITLTYSQGAQMQYDNWSANASVGNLKITFVNSVNYYNTISAQHEFRYVIIPGGVAAAGGRAASVQADYIARLQAMSYSEAMAELGVPE